MRAASAASSDKILPRRQKPHHQESGFHQIAAVIERAERDGLAGLAMQEMRIGAVMALGVLQNFEHMPQPRQRIGARHPAPFHRHHHAP